MKSSHTPGPWIIAIPPVGADEIRSDDERGYLVCELPYGAIGAPESANAALIAAAPDLLEAVKAYDTWIYEAGSARANGESVYSYAELQAMRDRAVQLGRAALAKATGAQP